MTSLQPHTLPRSKMYNLIRSILCKGKNYIRYLRDAISLVVTFHCSQRIIKSKEIKFDVTLPAYLTLLDSVRAFSPNIRPRRFAFSAFRTSSGTKVKIRN